MKICYKASPGNDFQKNNASKDLFEPLGELSERGVIEFSAHQYHKRIQAEVSFFLVHFSFFSFRRMRGKERKMNKSLDFLKKKIKSLGLLDFFLCFYTWLDAEFLYFLGSA